MSGIEYKLARYASWDETADELSAFKVRKIRFIPNPKRNIIYNAEHSVTLTPDDISKSIEDYDWETIEVKQYIDTIRLEGHYRYLRDQNIKTTLKTKTIPGYKLDLQLPKSVIKKWYEKHCCYHSSQGSFYVLWRRNCWEGNRPKTPYWRPYSVKLIIKPNMYQNIWETALWAEKIVMAVEDKFCLGYLTLKRIELPIDCDIPKNIYKSLEPCLYRKHSDEMLRKEDEDDPEKDTLYDGRNKKAKRNKIYYRKGLWHLEPTWTGRAFLSKKEHRHLSAYAVLLYLINIYDSTEFRYLDLYKLTASRKCKDKAFVFWKFFCREGVRGVANAIDVYGKYKNAHRLFSNHPINPFFKETMAGTIRNGLEIVAERTRDASLLPDGDIVEALNDKTTRKELKRKLAQYSSQWNIDRIISG